METVDPIKQILNELFSLLETLETQNGALVAFLKDQKIASDEKLAPYLERAGNASSVKWRAARARMEYLLAPVPKKSTDEEKDKSKESEQEPAPSKAQESSNEPARRNEGPQAEAPTKSDSGDNGKNNQKSDSKDQKSERK